MPSKPRSETEPEPGTQPGPQADDHHLAGVVRDSTHQIWLAGLGAFAKAQQEGSKVFEALVKEGADLQRRTMAASGERLGDVTDRVARAAGDLSHQATHSLDRLETAFEDRVAKVLGRLGVPSTRDIRELTGLLNALNEKVATLSEAAPWPAVKTGAAKKGKAAVAAEPPSTPKSAKVAKSAAGKPGK